MGCSKSNSKTEVHNCKAMKQEKSQISNSTLKGTLKREKMKSQSKQNKENG